MCYRAHLSSCLSVVLSLFAWNHWFEDYSPVPNLRRVRGAVHMSVVELSRLSGLSRQAIIDLEFGRAAAARPSTIRRLAEALGTEPAVLVRGQPRPLVTWRADIGIGILWSVHSDSQPDVLAWIPVTQIADGEAMDRVAFAWREATEGGAGQPFPDWLASRFGAQLIPPDPW